MDLFKEMRSSIYSLIGKDLIPINAGKHREVYRIQTNNFDTSAMSYNGKVVKWEKDRTTKDINAYEHRTYMSIKGTSYEDLFCPIRLSSNDHEFIVMDYADPEKSNSEHADKILEQLSSSDIFKFEIGTENTPRHPQERPDINGYNVGYHQNQGHVLLDYPYGGKFQY